MLCSSAHYPLSCSRYHSPPVWVEFYIHKLKLNKIFVFKCSATCGAVSCSVSPPAQNIAMHILGTHVSTECGIIFVSGHFSINLIFSLEFVYPWWWCWGFRSSGMWRCVVWWMIPDSLKPHDPLKHHESLTQWHSFTSQKSWILILSGIHSWL